MRRPRRLLVVAGAVVAAHVAMRALGLAEHTSIVAGMPQDAWSYVVGPTYVLVHLLAVVAAPVFALACAFDAAAARASVRMHRQTRVVREAGGVTRA